MAGLGSFLSGAVQGYDQGLEQARKNKEEKRREEEMGLRRQKAELDKKAAEQQQVLTQAQIDAQERERAYQADLKEQLANLTKQKEGFVSGEVIDEMTGQSMGNMTFGAGQAPTAGLRFREGTVAEQKPMNELDYQFRVSDTLKAVAARHGKLDLKMLEESQKFGKRLRSEGALEAMQYFYSTGDEAGTKEMFNKKGNIKLGDDVRIGLKDGLFGPTMYGYKVGKDGKPQEVFDGFRDLILPSMSPEAYTAFVANSKIKEVQEKGDTFRAGLGAQATRDAAVARGRSGGDDDKLPPEVRAFNERMNKEFESVFKMSGASLNPERETFVRGEMSRVGRSLIDRGMNANEAYSTAMKEVFTKYGIPMPKPVAQPKK